MDAQHVVDFPRPLGEKLWYIREVDSNKDGKFDGKDGTVLVICDKDGKNPLDLTEGKTRVRAFGTFGAGILYTVDGIDPAVIAPDGKRKTLWLSTAPIQGAAVSPDGKKIVFAVLRDTTADGKFRTWEDAADLMVLSVP